VVTLGTLRTVISIVTPAEMAAIDAAATEPVEVLIERAGSAVARAAVRMMGGTYGRRVTVVAGRGNNGNDGRAAARRLARRGVQVHVIDAADAPAVTPPCDLVIDAAYGTGFHGTWTAPDTGAAAVLAVDIPSGVDGVTGAAGPGVLPADRTVTFAALKPGQLFPPGSELAGSVEVADIGLDVSAASAHLVQQPDVATWLPERPVESHKWRAAVWVIAGSGGMLGSAHLASRAAQRAGAGMVRLSSPGVANDPASPTEVVGRPLPSSLWAAEALTDVERFHAVVVGPGLGRADATATSVRELVAKAQLPLVVDGDGLFALAWSSDGAAAALAGRDEPTVLTPHDGEFAFLRGTRPGRDRIDAARRLAIDLGCVVLLKGPTTVVAAEDGRVLVVTAGDERLATAGTGDVLAGIIGALLAPQVPAFEAAAAGAWLHGQAGRRGHTRGLVAGDLPDLLPAVLEDL
jgi:ADP-dependent NAD(P)H-hydrate dehydratase / NAD(P)H-hydrate epimerase